MGSTKSVGSKKLGKKGPPVPGGSNVTVTGSFPMTVNAPTVSPNKFTMQSFTMNLTTANNLLVALSNAINNAAVKKSKTGGGKKGK
jgi:hypothetical protein